ncbi:hypothetical protein Egran_06972 [Elaphomyces granulatus]|uniref:FAD-binding domain-containing protein n=1 Tax=Elaphomyces granulatus TaxID=519963 RepID=A0A232LM81_9EURO|nr:hypothetical protein Egran_06972 [Elaphomyces granulatus]
MMFPNWQQLDVAVIGGGIGGLASATALRRAGHKVTIYERADYVGEIGAPICCAANASRWLEEWGVDIGIGKPVVMKKLILHKWETGEVQEAADFSDYKERWGYVCNLFHRVDMHRMLMASATGPGEGEPALLKTNHACKSVDHKNGILTFKNNVTAKHDLIVGADGIGSVVRTSLGISPEKKQSTSTCYYCIIETAKVRRLGLTDLAQNSAIQLWGGSGIDKITAVPSRGGDIEGFYCFFPTVLSDHSEEGWNHEATVEQLLAPYPTLDANVIALLRNSTGISPWRLFVHKPYPHWQEDRACILGDAAHPMMPDQAQGSCQAIEDAAALGIIFGPKYSYTHDINAGLKLYEKIRKPRASKVQAASARARENARERIGFSSKNPDTGLEGKITAEEINEYVCQ